MAPPTTRHAEADTEGTANAVPSPLERREIGDDTEASTDLQMATSQTLYRLECRADDLLDKDERQLRELRELRDELRALVDATAAE